MAPRSHDPSKVGRGNGGLPLSLPGEGEDRHVHAPHAVSADRAERPPGGRARQHRRDLGVAPRPDRRRSRPPNWRAPVASPKFTPLIVTRTPERPDPGESAVIFGFARGVGCTGAPPLGGAGAGAGSVAGGLGAAASTVKLKPLDVPPLFWTVTAPLAAPAGTLTEMRVLPQPWITPSLPPPKKTLPELPKALPSTATVAPTAPRAGLMPEIDGLAGAGAGLLGAFGRAPKSCTQ